MVLPRSCVVFFARNFFVDGLMSDIYRYQPTRFSVFLLFFSVLRSPRTEFWTFPFVCFFIVSSIQLSSCRVREGRFGNHLFIKVFFLFRSHLLQKKSGLPNGPISFANLANLLGLPLSLQQRAAPE